MQKEKGEEMRIAERMITEDQYLHKKELVEEKNRSYKKKYQNEMGRATKESRVSNYMKANVIGGSEYVSLTGTQKFEPSAVTMIKDHTFGFGNLAINRPDIVDRIQSKKTNAGVEYDPMFVPKMKGRATDDGEQHVKGEGMEDLLAVTKASVAPGASAKAFNNGDEPPLDALADIATGGMTEEDRMEQMSLTNNGDKKRFAPPVLSVLEQRMMREARVRQRANIVEKQVVWGKEFQGRAFLSQPEEIVFEDFTVDIPVTQQFILTNVSNTFNNFSLLQLPEEVIDFFEISYHKPGRMSAGMTCSLTITFTPKINRDVVTEIPFLAKTGPFTVPIRCLTKKAIPKVKCTDIDLGNVVMGESNSVALEIVNEGALNVNYELIELESNYDTSTSLEPAVDDCAIQGDAEGNDSNLNTSDTANKRPELEYVSKGTFSNFETSFVPFTFTPSTVGNLKRTLLLKYNDATCADVVIHVSARGVKVPIFIENPS